MATLNISFTVPDAEAVRIRQDFAEYHGWRSTIPDPDDPEKTIANPENQVAFVKRKIGDFIKESVKAQRANAASEAARAAAVTAVNTGVVLT